MIELSLSDLATLYVGVFFATILVVVSAAAAARRRRSAPGPQIVRCHLCAMTFQPDRELAACPRCGSRNERTSKRDSA